MKTRIAFVIDVIETPTGGTERQLLKLIDNIDHDCYEPWLCCLRSSKWLTDEWDKSKWHVAEIHSFNSFHGWINILCLALWLRRMNFKVVQTHFRDGSIAGQLAAWLARVPVIIGTRRGRPLYNGVLGRLLFRLLNTIPDRFVANSKFTRDLAVQQEGISPKRFCVVPNALDLEVFPPLTAQSRSEARSLIGVDDGLPVVGIVANLNPWKRHDLLFRAVAILAGRGLVLNVVCIGGGEQAPLIRLTESLGIAHRVTFLGSRRDVPSLLAAFDVGVLCSDFESSSNSVIEYLAAGLPVVCTNVGGLPETVEEGVNGLLVPPDDPTALADSLESILRTRLDAGKFQRFREELMQRHSPGNMVAGHLAAYGFAEGGA